MYHIRLGEDPGWASYCRRERLDLTDPPMPPLSQSNHSGLIHGLIVVFSILAIAALIRADASSSRSVAATSREGSVANIQTQLVVSLPAQPLVQRAGAHH